MIPCPYTSFGLIIKKPVHAVTRIRDIQQAVVDPAFQDHVRLTLETNELACGADGGEGKQVI
jgi:hypothetical protein